jgi:hypothetical protein
MEGCDAVPCRTVPYHTVLVLCYQHTVRGSKKDAKKYITLDVDETQTKLLSTVLGPSDRLRARTFCAVRELERTFLAF